MNLLQYNISCQIDDKIWNLRNKCRASDLDRLDGRSNHHLRSNISDAGTDCKLPLGRQRVIMLLETLRVSCCSRWRNSEGTAEEQQNPALEGWCEHHHDGEWMDFAFRCSQYLWAGRVTVSGRSNESISRGAGSCKKGTQSSPSSAKCQPRKATARARISNESSSRPRVPASPCMCKVPWLHEQASK